LDVELLNRVERGANAVVLEERLVVVDAIERVMFWSLRLPVTATVWPPIRKNPPALEPGEAPGNNRVSCVKSRPFKGSSTISVFETTVPIVDLVVCNWAAPDAITSTVSTTSPTCRPMSRRTDWFTCTTTPLWMDLLKPVISTATS